MQPDIKGNKRTYKIICNYTYGLGGFFKVSDCRQSTPIRLSINGLYVCDPKNYVYYDGKEYKMDKREGYFFDNILETSRVDFEEEKQKML